MKQRLAHMDRKPLPDDARKAFLFEEIDGDRLGVCLSASGNELPTSGKWQFVRAFQLGVQEPGLGIPPEPILRGIVARGYFVWHDDGLTTPYGTSQ